MSYVFVNKSAVINDIEDIVGYYSSINRELATSFLDQVEIAKKYIADFPEAFQIKYKNVRTVLLEQFPYHTHYFLNDAKKQIVVLGVIHAYRTQSFLIVKHSWRKKITLTIFFMCFALPYITGTVSFLRRDRAI